MKSSMRLRSGTDGSREAGNFDASRFVKNFDAQTAFERQISSMNALFRAYREHHRTR
jgi:hypothetical protein